LTLLAAASTAAGMGAVRLAGHRNLRLAMWILLPALLAR